MTVGFDLILPFCVDGETSIELNSIENTNASPGTNGNEQTANAQDDATEGSDVSR